MQFIFSSHSPLVTGSMEWSNIWVMHESGPRQLPDEPIHGLSADQVLLSPYFGLSSTRSDEKMHKLFALNARAIGGDATAANISCASLDGMGPPGPVAPTPSSRWMPLSAAESESWEATVKRLTAASVAKLKAKVRAK